MNIKPREGETLEDAILRELKYRFAEKNSNYIGPYVMRLSDGSQQILDDVVEYIKEHGSTKNCEECHGYGKFGVSIPGTGTVEYASCEGCGGSGKLPKDAEQPPPKPEGFYSEAAMVKFWR